MKFHIGKRYESVRYDPRFPCSRWKSCEKYYARLDKTSDLLCFRENGSGNGDRCVKTGDVGNPARPPSDDVLSAYLWAGLITLRWRVSCPHTSIEGEGGNFPTIENTLTPIHIAAFKQAHVRRHGPDTIKTAP